jgi:hypothetical protein
MRLGEIETSMITEDIDKYCKSMEEVKRRTIAIKTILNKNHTTAYRATNIEFVCLQIRKILELIALGSIVANKDEYARQHEKFAKHWHATRILDDVEELNPQFYPIPVRQVFDPKAKKVIGTVDISEGYLTREDFVNVYDRCSEILHAANPFGDGIDYAPIEQSIPIWLSKIKTLLDHHQIQLLNEKEQLWVLMEAKSDKKVHAYIFERIDMLPPITT